MVAIRRQVIAEEIPEKVLKKLASEVREVLKLLADENVAIKGGFARHVLIEMLFDREEFFDEERREIERRIRDLDLCLPRGGTWVKSQEEIIAAGMALQAKLAEHGFILEPDDTEFVKGSSFTSEVILDILTKRDLTINEVVLICGNGKWFVHYTLQCLRDLKDGVGMWNPKQNHTWYHRGVAYPSPFGLIRLIKFLVAGKVHEVVLPKFWLELYLAEAGRRMQDQENKAFPEGAPLGHYGLVLFLHYFGDDPEAQKKALKILRDWGFTSLETTEEYISQQKRGFEGNDMPFELHKMTWEEAIAKQKDRNEMAQNGRRQRKVDRQACQHEMAPFICKGCAYKCRMLACRNCTFVQFEGRGSLPCNNAVGLGLLPTMPDPYYPRGSVQERI